MKNIQKLFVATITLLCCTVLFSCKEDACERYTCYNEGVCQDGECQCKDTFYGQDCGYKKFAQRTVVFWAAHMKYSSWLPVKITINGQTGQLTKNYGYSAPAVEEKPNTDGCFCTGCWSVVLLPGTYSYTVTLNDGSSITRTVQVSANDNYETYSGEKFNDGCIETKVTW